MALPPDQAALAQAHRRRQQVLAANAATAAGAVWAGWTAGGVLDWWNRRGAVRVLRLLIRAQLAAAQLADRYVTRQLQLQGVDPDPVGAVPARAFAGIAADGRPLDTLLRSPAAEVDAFIRRGMPTDQAKTIGERHLKRIVASETADAARIATGVALVNDRSATGYIRLLTPPSCSRCIILAGRWYRWSSGFLRHPLCDCVMVPAPDAGDVPGPKAVFESLDEADQDRVFTKAGAQAIRDGADIYSVVNARRGLYVAGIGARKVKATREGTTTRGTFGGYELGADGKLRRRGELVKRAGARYRAARVIRLTPEQIYLDAEDRDDAIRLLKRNGYIR